MLSFCHRLEVHSGCQSSMQTVLSLSILTQSVSNIGDFLILKTFFFLSFRKTCMTRLRRRRVVAPSVFSQCQLSQRSHS